MNQLFIDIFCTMNGREQATIAWIVIFLIFMLINGNIRKSLFGVIKSLLNVKIFIPLLMSFLYSAFAVYLLSNLNLWNVKLLKDTIFWFSGTLIVIFLNTNKASQNPNILKKMLIETVTFTAVIQFLANLYSFSFLVEFLVLPIVFFVSGMSALADFQEEHKIIRKPLKIILSGYGLFILTYSIYIAVSNLTDSITLYNLLTFLIPSLLTIMYLPFIYFFALIMLYESLFLRLDRFVKNKKLLNFSKLKIILVCNINLPLLNKFSKNTGREIMNIKTKKDVLNILENLK